MQLALLLAAALLAPYLLARPCVGEDIHDYQDEHFLDVNAEAGYLVPGRKELLQISPAGEDDDMVEQSLEVIKVEVGEMDLIDAIMEKDVETVYFLIEHGADVNYVRLDFTEPTVLHFGVESEVLPIVKALVEAGANVNAPDRFGMTPLHYAAFAGSYDISKFLLESGSNPLAVDVENNSPLHLATYSSNYELPQLLIKFGGDISLQDIGGDTALHQAAEQGHPKMVEVLLDLGADPTIPDEGGSTAIEEICEDVSTCSQDVRDQIHELLSNNK